MTSLSNVDAPNQGDLAADLKEASSHRRHYGAACPTPERTMSLMRSKNALEIEIADRERSFTAQRDLGRLFPLCGHFCLMRMQRKLICQCDGPSEAFAAMHSEFLKAATEHVLMYPNRNRSFSAPMSNVLAA